MKIGPEARGGRERLVAFDGKRKRGERRGADGWRGQREAQREDGIMKIIIMLFRFKVARGIWHKYNQADRKGD